jgi:diguanylate cyclase (GGDEF)-like protein
MPPASKPGQKIPNLKAFPLRFSPLQSVDGETMATATSTLPNIAAGELDGADTRLTPEILARRAKQRRQILDMTGLSYVVDGLVLLIYAYIGIIPVAIPVAYMACGLCSVAIYIALSEFNIHDRFNDHYLIVQQSSVSLAILLSFAYFAPEVGFMFLCTLFIVYGFSSLRATPRQIAVSWTMAAIGVAALFLTTDKPISMPISTPSERFTTMLVFILILGRCMFIGIFSSSLRASLYKSGQQLREAYKRIEELAELDELTGSFNRRCIMKLLDDEIARAHRSGASCSVALIDLDWFKHINDTFGHPTGDEVLRTFAITVFANIRAIDKFGRYGGEEFLLILPDTDDRAAEQSLDRLRAIIAELDWSAFSPGMTVTISAGVAMLKPDETPDTILARADSALYAAKERGRNRIARA